MGFYRKLMRLAFSAIVFTSCAQPVDTNTSSYSHQPANHTNQGIPTMQLEGKIVVPGIRDNIGIVTDDWEYSSIPGKDVSLARFPSSALTTDPIQRYKTRWQTKFEKYPESKTYHMLVQDNTMIHGSGSLNISEFIRIVGEATSTNPGTELLESIYLLDERQMQSLERMVRKIGPRELTSIAIAETCPVRPENEYVNHANYNILLFDFMLRDSPELVLLTPSMYDPELSFGPWQLTNHVINKETCTLIQAMSGIDQCSLEWLFNQQNAEDAVRNQATFAYANLIDKTASLLRITDPAQLDTILVNPRQRTKILAGLHLEPYTTANVLPGDFPEHMRTYLQKASESRVYLNSK